MREDRIRKNKKMLKVLSSNGFRKPYQIIVDSGFMKLVKRVRNPARDIATVLKDMPKFFTTKCEYSKYKSLVRPKDLSGECEIIKCGHQEPVDDCIDQFIREKNKNHYILAFWGDKKREEKIVKMSIPILRYKNSVFYAHTNELKIATKKFEGEAATPGELRRLSKLVGDGACETAPQPPVENDSESPLSV